MLATVLLAGLYSKRVRIKHQTCSAVVQSFFRLTIASLRKGAVFAANVATSGRRACALRGCAAYCCTLAYLTKKSSKRPAVPGRGYLLHACCKVETNFHGVSCGMCFAGMRTIAVTMATKVGANMTRQVPRIRTRKNEQTNYSPSSKRNMAGVAQWPKSSAT